jgi:hypothetical protein
MENVQFECRLEGVPEGLPAGEAPIGLFQGPGQEGGAAGEFLLHLEAEVADKGGEKVQEAELVVVVDRSGSMQGVPWRQVQGALGTLLGLTRGQGNIRQVGAQ